MTSGDENWMSEINVCHEYELIFLYKKWYKKQLFKIAMTAFAKQAIEKFHNNPPDEFQSFIEDLNNNDDDYDDADSDADDAKRELFGKVYDGIKRTIAHKKEESEKRMVKRALDKIYPIQGWQDLKNVVFEFAY